MSGHLIDATRVRAHVRRLVDDGMRQSDIAKAAAVSPATISILLHGAFSPGRPMQLNMQCDTATRLLNVLYEPPPERQEPAEGPCVSADRFELVGYRVGRCLDCGQLAPVRRLSVAGGYRQQIISHPRPDAA